MVGQRKALIVANDEYEHEGLRRLRSPAADAEALARVLGDLQIGAFGVQTVLNQPSHVIQNQIEDLLAESRPEDVILLHFSCHGLKSESGELFFAARNTRPDRLGSTAIPADFVQRCLRTSRSRSIVLLLDCCYGGAFGKGVTVRSSGDANVLDSFPSHQTGGGRGRAVITASSSIEYAFEGDQLADAQTRRPSVFTTALVEGLATGEADRDEDGWVSLNELYDYVFDKVRAQTPHQTPSRDVEMQGELYLARSRRRRIRPLPIPEDLRSATKDPNIFTRLGAVTELRSRLVSENLPAAAGAYEALVEIARSDIHYVAAPAEAALDEVRLHPVETELHFDQLVQGSAEPHRVIHLLGPPIAHSCGPHGSDGWIRISETADGFDVSVDTAELGSKTGSIELKGTTGAVTIEVSASVVPRPVEPPEQPTVTAVEINPPRPAPEPVKPQLPPPSTPAGPADGATPAPTSTPAQPSADRSPEPLPVHRSEPGPAPSIRRSPAPPERDEGRPPAVSAASPRTMPARALAATSPDLDQAAGRAGRGAALGSVLWALLPALSVSLLTPVPFVHAAVRLKGRQWVTAALYVLAWALMVALLGAQVEATPAVMTLLMVVGTVHAFQLRRRMFPRVSGGEAATTPAVEGRPVALPRTADAEPRVPHFKVVALGVAGSGKTVFLSSMFHLLNVPMPTRSYFLETSASHRVYLSKIFDEVSDTAEPWPRGTRTGETREVDFDCVAFDEGVKHQIFRIGYLDYAGELLESEQDAGSTALSELEARIHGAHGLLGILDGYRVLQYLRNERAGQRYFRSALQPMIGIMAGATCPIHFVLTKWDLVRGFGEPEDADDELRLGLVREALLGTPQLNALIETHSWGRRVVRLIPVSAVGPDFARIDREGHVLKRPDGELHPTNVEIPLTAILPDLFSQVESSLDASTRRKIVEQVHARQKAPAAASRSALEKFLAKPPGIALGRRLQQAVGASSGPEMVGMFLDWISGSETAELRTRGAAMAQARQKDVTFEVVRSRVMTEFSTAVRGFETRMPASRLSGG